MASLLAEFSDKPSTCMHFIIKAIGKVIAGVSVSAVKFGYNSSHWDKAFLLWCMSTTVYDRC